MSDDPAISKGEQSSDTQTMGCGCALALVIFSIGVWLYQGVAQGHWLNWHYLLYGAILITGFAWSFAINDPNRKGISKGWGPAMLSVFLVVLLGKLLGDDRWWMQQR